MSGKSAEGESAYTLLFASIILVVLAFFLWYVFRSFVLEGLRYMRLGEAWMVLPFGGDQLRACRDWLHMAKIDDMRPTIEIATKATGCFGDVSNAVPNRFAYYGLTGYSILAVESVVGHYYRWVWFALFASIWVYIAFFSQFHKFRITHNLESFIKVQAKMWSVIAPIVNFNPIKTSARVPGDQIPDKLPLFAEALSPEEWVSFQRIEVLNGVPDREATRRAFATQLGPRWTGINDCPLHIQALFAAYALKGSQRREESDEMLGRLSLCWTPKGNFKMTSELASEVKKIIRDPEIGGKALEIADQHAYRTTALLGVLKWGRWMGGVLAPAQFLWVRGADRNLWYPLNNLGRRSFHTEGAGAMAHFMAELNAKKPLPMPRLDTAVMSLNQYFNPAERTAPIVPPREGDKKAKARV